MSDQPQRIRPSVQALRALAGATPERRHDIDPKEGVPLTADGEIDLNPIAARNGRSELGEEASQLPLRGNSWGPAAGKSGEGIGLAD